MTNITIDRVVEEKTGGGIEFSRVFFSVVGVTTAAVVDRVLAKEMDDIANFHFDPATGKGQCVTIDFEPKVGTVFEII